MLLILMKANILNNFHHQESITATFFLCNLYKTLMTSIYYFYVYLFTLVLNVCSIYLCLTYLFVCVFNTFCYCFVMLQCNLSSMREDPKVPENYPLF